MHELFKYTLLICFLNVVPFRGLTQVASDSVKTDSLRQRPLGYNFDQRGLHRWSGERFSRSENSFGIMPSIQGFRNLYIGIGLSKGWFTSGEGVATGTGITLGVDYNPFAGVVAPKVSIWANGVVFIFMGSVGLTGSYYFQNEQRNFVLRPEIGIGCLKLFLHYGYGFFIRDDFERVNKHSVTLSYYHTIIPRRRSMKRIN